ERNGIANSILRLFRPDGQVLTIAAMHPVERQDRRDLLPDRNENLTGMERGMQSVRDGCDIDDGRVDEGLRRDQNASARGACANVIDQRLQFRMAIEAERTAVKKLVDLVIESVVGISKGRDKLAQIL